MIEEYYQIKNLPDFSFLNEKKHVISLVGAGGKTSIMFSLANYYAKKGLKVIVTTTTHIKKFQNVNYVTNLKQLEAAFKANDYAVIGKECEDNKLKMLDYDQLKQFIKLADIVLIEADGAKNKSFKVPNFKEPVLIDECDIVIGVVGLNSLNKKYQDACFRLEEALKFLDKKADDLIEVDDMVKVILAEKGLKKDVKDRDYFVVLNNCEPKQKEKANEIVKKLSLSMEQEKIKIIMKEG